MNPAQLKDLLTLAVEKMIRDDAARKPVRPLLSSAERSITAHLRDHIQQTLARYPSYRRYQVDHEYNRMGSGKSPKRSPEIVGNFVPDIAIHRRGVQASADPAANLLVVEVKQIATFAGSSERIQNKKVKYALLKDLRKLKVLADPGDAFKYRRTASLVFSSEAVWVAVDGSPFEKLLSLSHRG